MMIFKDLTDEILRVCRASSDTAFIAVVKKLINAKYFDLCSEVSIRKLRDKLTLDFTTSTDAGLWLPSDLVGIDMVKDEDDVEFYERDRSDIESSEYGFRYYRYKGSSDPLVSGDDVIIDQDSSSFTSVTVSAYIALGNTVLNQYIRFGSEMGFYKITNNASPFTIAPAYHGPFQDGKPFRIRTEEDERMVIIDNSEAILKDRSIDVYFWKAPQPLYRDSDIILLPSTMVLQLQVLRELPEAKALRPVSQGEIDDEKAKMIKLNPTFVRLNSPRDKHNNIFDIDVGKNYFSSRNG
jgi:hypothetical protein